MGEHLTRASVRIESSGHREPAAVVLELDGFGGTPIGKPLPGSSHAPVGVDGPEQDGDGVGLVIVGGAESTLAHRGDDCLLVGIAFAGDEEFDRPDRKALVSNRVLLAPSCQRGQQPAMNVRGIGAQMPAHFLVVHDADAARIRGNGIEPAAESQVANATAVVTAGAERHRAAGNRTAGALNCEAGGASEIKARSAADWLRSSKPSAARETGLAGELRGMFTTKAH